MFCIRYFGHNFQFTEQDIQVNWERWNFQNRRVDQLVFSDEKNTLTCN